MNAYKHFKAGNLTLPKGMVPKGPSRMKSYYTGGFESEMTRAEAALILSVRQGASKEKIKMAHRRIMLANHPDNGGSDYVASKVNEAKDLLLKDLGDD
ncbi:translocase of the inner mitochondrial membrane 14 isoform a, putative [Acanthamoeba castellanii str. Neff]|uniref:Translocase of the inner mitochondrial membrane 14 isoform a, putative n=2 Tax=Acanthamoeba castellanii TaxID=5755 RepID=L8H6X1_ACACF|nr:translocase of the inner mitochondrial membrane 14 isoform a, putative [Acanthamoeba castellanii str. Neff]AUI80419.1 Pam18 isoform A [Acanthamoeba castellanii]ELR21264.1 translocase of the inner mitochondrial membrane 14 isoform a, putative [Acanthamoeba castellanii str. Neff]